MFPGLILFMILVFGFDWAILKRFITFLNMFLCNPTRFFYFTCLHKKNDYLAEISVVSDIVVESRELVSEERRHITIW